MYLGIVKAKQNYINYSKGEKKNEFYDRFKNNIG